MTTADRCILAAPFVLLYGVAWTLLRPLVAALTRRWVRRRPIIVIRLDRRES